MRRIYLLLVAIIIILVTANVYYYLNIYRQQIKFQEDILVRQTEISSRKIEQQISDFSDEINYILLSEDITDFFIDPAAEKTGSRKIGIFFSKYKDLISNISLYDNNKNVFNYFKDRNNDLATDLYVSRFQTELIEDNTIESRSPGEYSFIIPAYTNNDLTGNLVVNIGLGKYAEKVFSNYHIEQVQWQILLNKDGSIVFSSSDPYFDPLVYSDLFTGNWPDNNLPGRIIHKLENGDSRLNVISTYYPVDIIDQEMLVIFSLDTGTVASYVLTSIITISGATFIVLILIISFFLYFLKNERREKQRSNESERSIKEIFESLPMGIIIKGLDGKIRMINSSALEILQIDDVKSILDKDLSNMFFLLRDYPGRSKTRQTENTSEYVYYDKNENEVILYKKEILARFLGKEVLVEAFINISPIEQARKNEILFNEAKSEFLKRLSHDIRNPLNGIQNMAGLLEEETESGSANEEKVKLIKHCCDDILLVVNDIMDFSGFETGNILVEEIPFVLPDEIETVVSPFRSKASGKNIGINILIDDNVPKNLIGDPFHIRQVLTNLYSNSLKYTGEGEINLTVRNRERTNGNILLEFILEDTGSGIAPEMLEILNRSGKDQGNLNETGFGLTKTRQLVNLLKGDIYIESPVTSSPVTGGPGTRVRFHIQVYSNEIPAKKLRKDHLKTYKDIRVLVLAESVSVNHDIKNTLNNFGLLCETTGFNDSTIDLIKTRIASPESSWSIIIIIDSANSNGFSIARKLQENYLDKNFLIIMISSANKTGNFIKSKRFGADQYIIEPYEASEIFDIIQSAFPDIAVPEIKKASGRPGTDLKILVAEDNHVNQIVMQSLFKSIGYDIELASNGKEVLEKIREKNYDIVFMDIRMPEKNGFDATYDIRKSGYKMPIVAVTANVDESDKKQALEVGMNDFITKPVRADIVKKIMIKYFAK